MVGVAGKFKGCNTCRSRRVKCDNIRPHCKKCRDGGRECAGYNRERVFIVGTALDRGRCSSHPHRSLLVPRKARKRVVEASRRTVELESEVERGDGCGSNTGVNNSGGVGHRGSPGKVRYLALPTTLSALERVFGVDRTTSTFTLPSAPLHQPPSLLPPMQERFFSLRAACLINADAPGAPDSTSISTCVFLYELGSSSRQCSVPLKAEPGVEGLHGNAPFRNILGGSADGVRLDGPLLYAAFPRHDFFARIYRPHLCFHALTHRYATFLADDDWCSIPWQSASKTHLDTLFDVLVLLPEIFARGEELETYPPNITRRLHATDLLDRCDTLDQRLDEWRRNINGHDKTPCWWEATAKQTNLLDPYHSTSSDVFDSSLEFRDVETAELMLYYWAAKCSFYRAVQHIHAICFADVVIPTALDTDWNSIPYSDTTTESPTMEFTPPQQRMERDLVLEPEWNPNIYMPTSAPGRVSPIYVPDSAPERVSHLYDSELSLDQYLSDQFPSQSTFSSNVPFGFESSSQPFLSSGVEFDTASFLTPVNTDFSQVSAYPSSATPEFYAYNPTPYVIPATPITTTSSNNILPTSFPALTTTTAATITVPSYSTNLSNAYLLSTSTPTSSRPSPSRTHSFSLSFPHALPTGPNTPSYIHSRSPTPTHTILSSAPSSNPSLRTSLSNQGQGSASASGSISIANAPLPSPWPVPPTSSPPARTQALHPKFFESAVVESARKIVRAVSCLLRAGGSCGIDNERDGWRAGTGGGVNVALWEAMKVFRRQGRRADVELCRALGEKAVVVGAAGMGAEVRRRRWMEGGGVL